MRKAFTLVELTIVIIIVGVLAALGISQYSTIVEKSSIAEAKIRVGTMHQYAHEYYLEHGNLTGIANSDVEVDNTCTSSDFYRYTLGDKTATRVNLCAIRCTINGKPPDVSRSYLYGMRYYPATGQVIWACYWMDDYSGCFGLPSWSSLGG